MTTAKKQIYGSTGIDSLAGPSEILIIADKTAKTSQLASDLLAQAEHDPVASSILLTTSHEQAQEVFDDIYKLLKITQERNLHGINKNWGLIVICDNTNLVLNCNVSHPNTQKLSPLIQRSPQKGRNAGAIFLEHGHPKL